MSILRKSIISTGLAFTLLSLSGCWSGLNVNTKPKVVDATIESVGFSGFTVKKGETLADLIKVIKDKKIVNIINQIDDIEKYKFDDDLNNISFESAINYLNRKYKSRLRYRTEGTNIVYIYIDKKIKKQTSVATNYIVKSFKELDKVKGLNKPINIKGEYTYNDIFYILKRSGVKVHFKIYEEANKLDRTLPVQNYYGTIKDFIKDVALENNYFVQVNEKTNTIYFTDRITKYYELKLQPVQIATSTNFESIMTDTIKPFDDLDAQLKQLIGKHGVYNINKTDGSLTVYGDTLALTMADSIVQKFNAIYGRSVKLEMHIYEVKLNSDKEAGIDFSNLVDSISRYHLNFGTDLTNNITKIGTKLALTQTESYLDEDNTLRKTNMDKVIFKFLNEYGHAKTLTKPIMETVNNLPVVMNFMDYQDYVKSIEERTTSTVGDNTSTNFQDTNVQTDEAKTGFILSMLPKIEDNDIVKIVIKPQISRLNSLTPYQYGSEDNPRTIMLKNTSERIMTQVVKIKDDQMAIIGGYIYEKDDGNKQSLPGIGSEDNPFDILTSSKTMKRSKYELVFTIKAKIIDF